jgi:hypothetical protein
MVASVEINQRAARVLEESLNVEEDELTPTATLQGDLGAESIAFLDIARGIQRSSFGPFSPRAQDRLPHTRYHHYHRRA